MLSGTHITRLHFTLLAIILALGGCGAASTPASRAPAVTAAASTTTPATNAANASASGAFVCANPPGSTATYAYVAKGGPMYLAKGCHTPVAVYAPAGRQYRPVAFSPSGNWLLAWDGLANPQQSDTVSCLVLVAVSSRTVTPTTLCSPYGGGSTGLTQWYIPIGWASDASFYLASARRDNATIVSPTTVSLVSLPQLTQTVVTKLTWVATLANGSAPSGIALRGDALYYGGYTSLSEGGAWLHRFSLSARTDTRIVRLGLAGSGDCQVSETPCAWTGPWDISRDGSKIAYHNPGPTQSLSDALTSTTETNTPLYVASSAGSGATRLFPQVALGGPFSGPSFSPDGRYLVATFSDFTSSGKVIFERLDDSSLTTAPSDLQFWGWTPQPGTALMDNIAASGAPDFLIHLELYNVVTGARAPLQPGTQDYVWTGVPMVATQQ